MTSLARNWQLVRHTETALRTGSESLGNVPALLRSLLEEQAWREFALPAGETVKYARFSEFVAARPPRGLGADLDVVRHVIGTADPDLLVMLREAEKVGRGRRTDLQPGVDSTPGDGKGESSDLTAARLAREAPDQYDAVRSGELSINAAAVAAGIRPKRISVRTDNPESIARSLHRHLTPEQLDELRGLL